MDKLIESFFSRHGFSLFREKVGEITDSALADMQKSLDIQDGGKQKMIATWIFPKEFEAKNQTALVIDAGGTNFRSCAVNFDAGGNAEISEFEKTRMPATERETSREEFFGQIADNLSHLKPLADSQKEVKFGFCFSYALEMLPSGDGRAITFSKEIKAQEVVGALIGEELSKKLVANGWKKPDRMQLLNDTVSSLLAGFSAQGEGKKFSSVVGFIYGTGMNTAYIEPNAIKKNGGKSGQIVVCESGFFDGVEKSEFDEILDANSQHKGEYAAEKMCSGAYLPKLMKIIVQKAAEEGVFSEKACKILAQVSDFSLADSDFFMQNPLSETGFFGEILRGCEESDAEKLFTIFDSAIERAANVAAGIVAASAVKTGCGKSPLHPVAISCDGTTLFRTHSLFARICANLNRELTEKRGIYFVPLTIENAITIGTAYAALL